MIYIIFTKQTSQAKEIELKTKVYEIKNKFKYLITNHSQIGILNYLEYFYFLFNPDYKIFVARDEQNEIIHHSFIIPKYFRYNFLEHNSLMISNVWTKKENRNQNVATDVIAYLQNYYENRTLIYLSRENNKESVKVAQKNGFKYTNKCRRLKFVFISYFTLIKINLTIK